MTVKTVIFVLLSTETSFIYPIFVHVLFRVLYPEKRMKRESGESPEQSRCCLLYTSHKLTLRMERTEIDAMRHIALADFLARLGHEPVRRSGNELWYIAPYRGERTPSFLSLIHICRKLAEREIKVEKSDFNIDNMLTTMRQYYRGGRYDFQIGRAHV